MTDAGWPGPTPPSSRPDPYQPDDRWPSAGPPGAAPPPVRRPGRNRLRGFGIVLTVLAVIGGPSLIVFGVMNFPDVSSFERAVGPSGQVDLTAGRWTVFDEGGRLRGAELTITGPDGGVVEVEPSSTSSNYDINGRSGESIGAIEVPTDGVYDVALPAGDRVAFGQGFTASLVTSILSIVGGIVGGVLLLILGLVLLIVGWRR